MRITWGLYEHGGAYLSLTLLRMTVHAGTESVNSEEMRMVQEYWLLGSWFKMCVVDRTVAAL